MHTNIYFLIIRFKKFEWILKCFDFRFVIVRFLSLQFCCFRDDIFAYMAEEEISFTKYFFYEFVRSLFINNK